MHFNHLKMVFFISLVVSFSMVLPLYSQNNAFSGTPLDRNDWPALEEISEYTLVHWPVQPLLTYLDNQEDRMAVRFDFGVLSSDLILERHNRYRPETRVTYLTEQGAIQQAPENAYAYTGINTATVEPARFTILPTHFSGAMMINSELWIAEPLAYYLPDADPSILVLYKADAAKALQPYLCGTHPGLQSGHVPQEELEDDLVDRSQQSLGCKEVEYAIGVDWLFVNRYGGTFGAITRIETIMALVEWQYTGKFSNHYMFPIVEYVISTCNTCDPPEWTNTLDPVELLFNFRTWGEGGGFSAGEYDVAGLWTAREFDGPIIGVAFIEGVCNDERYHAIMDFSPNTSLMRVMVSHEFGHNFGADHDASGSFIMAPTVNQSTSWSNLSKTVIDAYTNTLQCLDECIYYPPPEAHFSATPTEGCAPFVVEYTDESLFDPTEWSWSFPGGVPSSSQEQNPVIIYSNYGSYQATLVASNVYGTDQITMTNFITVDDGPIAQFFVIIDGLTVYFLNESVRADSYLWDFGDGTTSTEAEPEHTYLKDSTYLVRLETINACGMSEVTDVIVVLTPPIAAFQADTLWGCASLQVKFTDQSTSNTEQRLWLFPGAVPNTSTEKNPVVTYPDSGSYQVTLIVSNVAGTDTLIKNSYIQVRLQPDSTFQDSILIDSLFVQYFGVVDSILWDFGDSTFSTAQESSHRYEEEGDYLLRLSIYSPCGVSELSRMVTILFVPEAAFQVDTVSGCAPMIVQYTDLSSANTASREWLFPGGDPTSSQDSIVDVFYGQSGMYSATLIATNASGSDTLIQLGLIEVDTFPVANFSFTMDGMTYTFTSHTPDAAFHEWDFGDGNTGSGDSVTHTYFGAGVRIVTYTAINDCGMDTATTTILLVPSALEEAFSPGFILLAPNPVNDLLAISQPTYKRDLTSWSLIDINGRIVGSGLFEKNNALHLIIPMQSYASGMYFLQIQDRQGHNSWHRVVKVEGGY